VLLGPLDRLSHPVLADLLLAGEPKLDVEGTKSVGVDLERLGKPLGDPIGGLGKAQAIDRIEEGRI